MKIAVQLYTLRELLAADTWGTLRRLAAMGFKTGQLAGTYGHTGQEFADRCREIGFRGIAPHLGIDEFEDRPEEVAGLCRALGTDTAVLPWIGKEVYGDGWARAAARLDRIGRTMKGLGLRFLYHNHSFEFEFEGDRPGFDVLWESADPSLVGCEMDVYWVRFGGGDPVAYLKSLMGRVRTMHFKDMADDEKRGMEDVGYGILDWDSIIPAAREAGVEYAIIEHDAPPGDPLEHVARSRDFLIGKGLSD